MKADFLAFAEYLLLVFFELFDVCNEYRSAADNNLRGSVAERCDIAGLSAHHHRCRLCPFQTMQTNDLERVMDLSSSTPISRVVLPSLRKPPEVASLVKKKPASVKESQTQTASFLLIIAVISFIVFHITFLPRGSNQMRQWMQIISCNASTVIIHENALIEKNKTAKIS